MMQNEENYRLTGLLEITLLSPLCAATGDGIAGMVDTDIAQEYGVPLIPAKRCKGCLLAVGKELAAFDNNFSKAVELLFGKSGNADCGALQMQDAHLYRFSNPDPSAEKAELTIENYTEFVAQLQSCFLEKKGSEKVLSAEDVLSCFSSLRTRTALESGQAKDTALFTMRIANEGLVFRANLHLCCARKELEAIQCALEQCVKGLRHIGLGITRGFGEVRCTLTEWRDAESANSFDFQTTARGEGELQYLLELQSPLLISGQEGLYSTCEDMIPGSAILGAFAKMYIEDYSLGENAHTDTCFSKLFLRNGLIFDYAFPAQNEDLVFRPCPNIIQREKTSGRYYCADVKNPEGLQLQKEHRFISFQDDSADLLICELEKEIRMHHARPLDRGIGYAVHKDEVESRDEKDGQFFQYVSISAGQCFRGTLQGDRDDIEKLLKCLQKRNNRLSLGRSRTAEYGNMIFQPIWFTPKEEMKSREMAGSKWILWFVTPMLLRDSAGRDTLNPMALIEQMNQRLKPDISLKITAQYLGISKVAGYNTKWRFPKPQRNALAAGTTLVVESSTACSANRIQEDSWGENTGEGYGRIQVLPYDLFASKANVEGKTEQPCLMCLPYEKEEYCKAIDYLLKYKLEQMEIAREKEAANLAEIGKLEAAMIAQLEDKFAAVGYCYETLKNNINEKKWAKVESFLEICKGKSEHFIRTYLQRAKWEARRESDGNTKNI